MGHSTVFLKYKGEAVVTDPLFRTRLYHLRRHSQIPSCVDGGAKTSPIVLISHLHQDHLDIPSLRRLGKDATIVVPPGAGKYLSDRLSHDILELGVGDTLETMNLTVLPVEARHGGQRWPGLRAEAQGYVIRAGATIYFAGDTGFFPAMEDVGRDHGVGVALLPVWGHGPRLGKHHMGPLDAAKALAFIGADMAVPIHWGTLRPVGVRNHAFLSTPPREFATHASILAPDAVIKVLEPCEETTIHIAAT
jgi:L-ascorbate metabolism protein UlaG (beta-lactamase superfamily)